MKQCVLVVAMLALAGCASTPPVVGTADTEGNADRIVAAKLGVAADAQRDFVAMVAEQRSVILKKQAAFDSDELDVDYYGLPQEMLETVAYRYGYRYIEVGARTQLKPINIVIKKASPTEVLRNIGHQVDDAANIILDRNAKVIRLVYKANGGLKG